METKHRAFPQDGAHTCGLTTHFEDVSFILHVCSSVNPFKKRPKSQVTAYCGCRNHNFKRSRSRHLLPVESHPVSVTHLTAFPAPLGHFLVRGAMQSHSLCLLTSLMYNFLDPNEKCILLLRKKKHALSFLQYPIHLLQRVRHVTSEHGEHVSQ